MKIGTEFKVIEEGPGRVFDTPTAQSRSINPAGFRRL